jgi:Tol biopolymer transport system component
MTLILGSDSKNIFTIRSDGTGKTYLTGDGAGYFNGLAAWSYDGSKIVYTHQTPNGTPYIWTMNADGSGKQQLTSGTLNGASASFSPDGKSILFTSFATGNAELWVMNADGTNPLRLTTTTGSATTRNGTTIEWAINGSYSPDGKQIVYASTQSGHSEIWVMNADGSGQTQVTFATDSKDRMRTLHPGRRTAARSPFGRASRPSTEISTQ